MTSVPILRIVSRDELATLIAAFIDDCQLAELSPRTIYNYERALRRYHWWCSQESMPLDVADHTASTIRAFLLYLQTTTDRWDAPSTHTPSHQPVTARSRHAYHRILSRFYNWLVEQEYLDETPMSKVRAPKFSAEQPDPFDDDELARLAATLRNAPDDFRAERDRAIVAVLLDVGLRASELCAIEVSHYDIATGDLLVIAGKGNKARQLRLGSRARRQVRRYWLRYRQFRGEVGGLFIGYRGTSLTRSGLQRVIRLLGETAVVDPCHPHRFRHTAAVSAIRAGMREFELQMMLGHTSLEMTRRYVKLVEADLVRAAREHSALDHLKLNL